MNIYTALNFLLERGPSTPKELKHFSGLKQTGVPFSSRLSYAVVNGYATKKKLKKTNTHIYAITAKGTDALNQNRHEIESIDVLKGYVYSSSGKIKNDSLPSVHISKSNSEAINSFVEILEANAKTIDFVRTLNAQINQFLKDNAEA